MYIFCTFYHVIPSYGVMCIVMYITCEFIFFLNFFPFSSKEDAGGGDDLLRSASKTAENG